MDSTILQNLDLSSLPQPVSVLIRLLGICKEKEYMGYDPYDALNSPLMPLLSLQTDFGRIAWTQLLRRSPLNLRSLLLIKKGQNPKGLGLFLQSYMRLYRLIPQSEILEYAAELVTCLKTLRSPNASGSAWGYNFPWQNRYQCLPRYTPTIVNSSFIGHALLDYYEETGREEALELATGIPDFILNDLNRKKENDTFCFSYTPLDKTFVHNANMLGASLLIRLAQITGNGNWRDPALSSISYSLRHQHEDGSWFFAETPEQSWIDSFHTGFKLEALRYFLNETDTESFQNSYQKGMKFYAQNFFLPDGTPKYYHNKTYPIDIHAPAEGLFFFAGAGPEYRALSDRVYNWMICNMYSQEKGYFYFRILPHCTIKTHYMRWSSAWAVRGLSEYCQTLNWKPVKN